MQQIELAESGTRRLPIFTSWLASKELVGTSGVSLGLVPVPSDRENPVFRKIKDFSRPKFVEFNERTYSGSLKYIPTR